MAQVMAAKIPPLKPPHGLLSPTFWEEHGWLVAVLILWLLGVASLVWWWWRRSRIVPPTPWDRQLRDTLESWKTRPMDPALPSDVTRLVCRFVIRLYALPEGELTVEELTRALDGRAEVCGDCREAVKAFLRMGDARKFSSAPPDNGPNWVSEASALLDRLQAHQAAGQPAAALGDGGA